MWGKQFVCLVLTEGIMKNGLYDFKWVVYMGTVLFPFIFNRSIQYSCLFLNKHFCFWRYMDFQTVYTHMNLDNGQSELRNLIGQLQVHYFTYELLRSTVGYLYIPICPISSFFLSLFSVTLSILVHDSFLKLISSPYPS